MEDRHAVTTVIPEPVDNAQAGEKSDGQLLLDRLLEQCNRFNRIRQELDEVRRSIAVEKPESAAVPTAASSGPPPAPATSFFEGLHLIADGNDQVADEFERAVNSLRALF